MRHVAVRTSDAAPGEVTIFPFLKGMFQRKSVGTPVEVTQGAEAGVGKHGAVLRPMCRRVDATSWPVNCAACTHLCQVEMGAALVDFCDTVTKVAADALFSLCALACDVLIQKP